MPTEGRTNATLDEILFVFRRFRNRVAVFHFGDHADDYGLLFKVGTGETAEVYTEGFAVVASEQGAVRPGRNPKAFVYPGG